MIGPRSVIGPGVELGPHVVIGPDTTLGKGVHVFTGAVIGTDPQDLKYDGSQTRCEIGPRTIIREYATINRGTRASGATMVGSDTYIMSYVHIAHDCRIGNNVIMSNNTSLAGHCTIEDRAIMGGYALLHQFVRVGTYAMVGALSGLRTDAPPYLIVFGYPPAKVFGVNTIGLKRAGMSADTREKIKSAYRLLYRSGLNFSEALDRIRVEIEPIPEIDHLVQFFEKSRRGVARGISERPDVEIDEEYIDKDELPMRAINDFAQEANKG